MSSAPLFETERLLFRCATLDDLQLFERIFCDAEMMLFLGGPLAPERIRPLVQERMSDWLVHGHGKGVVVDKRKNCYIGTAGISQCRIPSEQGLEIGWMILPEKQRNGYASELTRGFIHYARTSLNATRLLAQTHPGNEVSNRLLANLGFSCSGEREVSLPAFPTIKSVLVWELPASL